MRLWTREAGDFRDVLPRAAEWDCYENGHAEIVGGDNDMVLVAAPEEDADLPPDLTGNVYDTHTGGRLGQIIVREGG